MKRIIWFINRQLGPLGMHLHSTPGSYPFYMFGFKIDCHQSVTCLVPGSTGTVMWRLPFVPGLIGVSVTCPFQAELSSAPAGYGGYPLIPGCTDIMTWQLLCLVRRLDRRSNCTVTMSTTSSRKSRRMLMVKPAPNNPSKETKL